MMTMAIPRSQKILPDGMLGMLIFAVSEAILFAGLISAYTIARANAMAWPPPGQPLLPVGETAFNTVALVVSGFFLHRAAQAYKANLSEVRGPVVSLQSMSAAAKTPFLVSILLGGFFVVFQGYEWAMLLGQGLTLTSSQHGSFFYLIIGLHALHAIAAIALLVHAYIRLLGGRLTESLLGACQVLWYFVVGLWPILYWRVYL